MSFCPKDQQTEEALTLETKKLLEKGAIKVVQDPSSPGFYSCFFLVDKKDGGYCPIIDLSVLNTHLEVTKFKMETTSSIMASLKQVEWTMSIDLKDAYFRILIAKWSRKYLCFVIGDKIFCFGHCPSDCRPLPLYSPG